MTSANLSDITLIENLVNITCWPLLEMNIQSKGKLIRFHFNSIFLKDLLLDVPSNEKTRRRNS